METKSFTVPVLVSLVSGKMLTTSFSALHECAEFVMGHPVWTHEFASKPLWELMRSKVLEQHPDLDVDCESVTKENWLAFTNELIGRLGHEREIVKGEEERAADPITSLRAIVGDDKPIIVVKT
jgi:hypothetical protein